MPSKRRLVLGAVIPLFWFSLYTYNAYLTEYITSLGETMAFAGLVSGCYGLVQMLLRIPAGLLSDSIEKGSHLLYWAVCSRRSRPSVFFMSKRRSGCLSSAGLPARPRPAGFRFRFCIRHILIRARRRAPSAPPFRSTPRGSSPGSWRARS